MTFKTLAYVMTVGGCLLGLRFVFAGSSLLTEWGLDASTGALVVARRLGVIYLGVALLFFMGRAAAPSEMRTAVCLVTGATIALLAGLGLFDFWAHRVSGGVFRSVVAEALLAACFVWVGWRG